MKRVFIALEGRGPVYWMQSLNEGVNVEDVDLEMDQCDLEDEGVLDEDLNEVALILEDVKVGYYEGEEPPVKELWTDITKQKGKYVLVSDYFSAFKRKTQPFWVHQVNECDIWELFCIELNDDEEFDPKKLQLIKSEYELQILPYAIASDLIMYDGRLYCCSAKDGYLADDWDMPFIYEDDQPFINNEKTISIKGMKVY